MTWAFTLPWPSSTLSPNARTHWRAKAPVTKSARHTAWALAREAGAHKMPPDTLLTVAMTFHKPDRRRRDGDNLISATKAARDGIADAFGVDDSRFTLAFAFAPDVRPGGAVAVTVEVVA
jgi:crossover junction endodeoxyribonuclease RusA